MLASMFDSYDLNSCISGETILRKITGLYKNYILNKAVKILNN